jgi:serine/threonine-protein kinase HipA
VVEPSGAVQRIHQEDFCQVTGRPPTQKYQEDGGPSFAQIANTLREVDPASLETLLKAMTLHVLTGNGDAHGKNYSLLHEESGALRLAPIYDVMSTLYYKDVRLAMHIDSVQRLDRVTADRIINEATAWGMSRNAATDVVTSLLDEARTAIGRAAAETVPPPAEILDVVKEQLKRLTTKTSE